jgi:hypothetical protein
VEIEYEPRFVDDAVLRAACVRPEGRLFYRERERIYGLADAEARGRAFDALSAVWFERFGLAEPLATALCEQPLIAPAVGRCAVGHPPRPRDAGAELLVQPTRAGLEPAARRLLRLLRAPELLLAPAPCAVFLRRELLHVADMLDPVFGYEPRLPAVAVGPAHAALLRARYRVVWNVTVDGRLLRAGRLPAAVRTERLAEFQRTFPSLGDGAPTVFQRFFDDPAPSHAAIVALVTARQPGAGRSQPCALCSCPTADPDPDPAPLLETIRHDFPAWQPSDGCCRQCADLYRAAALSAASAAALPGVR